MPTSLYVNFVGDIIFIDMHLNQYQGLTKILFFEKSIIF